MKAIKHFVLITLGILILLIGGCSKKDDEESRQTGQEEGSIQKQGDVRTTKTATRQGVKTDPRQKWRRISIQDFPFKGIVWHGNGLWTSDSSNHMLAKISANGQILERVKSPTDTPSHMASDGLNLWLTDEKSRSIWKIPSNQSATYFETARLIPKGITCTGDDLAVTPQRSRGTIQFYPLTSFKESGRSVSKQDEKVGPVQSIVDLAWDGNYLWCLAKQERDRSSTELIGYDLKRQLPFTAIPLNDIQAEAVTYGNDRFYIACPRQQCIWQIPKPRCGDVYFDTPKEYTRLYVVGLGNTTKSPIHDVTVLVPEIPLEDISQEIVEIKFDPPHSEIHPFGEYQRYAVIKGLTIPSESVLSIHGIVRYTRCDYRMIILPNELRPLETLSDSFKKEHIGPATTVPILVEAAQEAGDDEINPYWRMRKIHDCIREHMRVDRNFGKPLEEYWRDGYTKCGGYSGLMNVLCWFNGLPCHRQGTGAASNHAWNRVYLPGLNLGIDVDVMRDDRQVSSSWYTCRKIGFGTGSDQLITRHPVGNWPRVSLEGRAFQLRPALCIPEGSELKKSFYVMEVASTTGNVPPACSCPTMKIEVENGVRLFWPEALDLEKNSPITYKVYASDNEPSQTNIEAGQLIGECRTTQMHSERLRNEFRYVSVVAIDSSGQNSATYTSGRCSTALDLDLE